MAEAQRLLALPVVAEFGTQATNDPAAAESLFEGFAKESLSQPDPPGWWHIYFGSHPTLLQRIEMAEAWKRGER